ncbi:hypothetical protein Si038_00747 [Streptococcus infantarius subsp. infantarius]|uniref:Uncharacterized protein n=1 Tax=Siphoviridae sp. ctC6Q17 TaxID=2827271 RepID=A0A8S5R3Y6_9CAUD|nr:hypothetical protein [Streptococcus infantarius subsp. infantarius]DAE25701.1 MAG TPA: hypothetical protein [Siphoviridae sp. ctC6Q17]
MINKISDLQKRKKHFQWVADSLEGKENELYVEKDWYDNPTLISKEDTKKEVEHTQKEIDLLQKKSKSIWKSMLRLFQRLWC